MIGLTIVVVDDEPELLSLLGDLLDDEGYQVVAVDNPTVIGAAIAQHEPALFLIDIMLPGITGIAVAAQLHTTGYSTIPMIAMSASPIMIRRAALSGWFTSTIDKPFDLDTLVGCVHQHLGGHGNWPSQVAP